MTANNDAYQYLSTNAYATSGTVAQAFVQFPVTMRVAPPAIESSTIGLRQISNNTLYTSGTFAFNAATPYLGNFIYTNGTSVFTAGNVCIVTANNSTSAYIGFSAEL